MYKWGGLDGIMFQRAVVVRVEREREKHEICQCF